MKEKLRKNCKNYEEKEKFFKGVYDEKYTYLKKRLMEVKKSLGTKF